jgi:hypothetical protein
MSLLNIPQISGPEVELLENEMYENLIQESSFSPLAAKMQVQPIWWGAIRMQCL